MRNYSICKVAMHHLGKAAAFLTALLFCLVQTIGTLSFALEPESSTEHRLEPPPRLEKRIQPEGEQKSVVPEKAPGDWLSGQDYTLSPVEAARQQKYEEPGQNAIDLTDRNQDGMISGEEAIDALVGLEKTFGRIREDPVYDARYDFDESGAVDAEDAASLDTVLAPNSAQRRPMLNAFLAVDQDHDRYLSGEEVVRARAGIARARQTSESDPDFNPLYDFDKDRKVGDSDDHLLLSVYGGYVDGLAQAVLDAFDVLDGDRDWKISAEETILGWARFKKSYGTEDPSFDFNGDGTVSILDFRALRQVVVMSGYAAILTAWTTLDTDDDGQISAREAISGWQEFQKVYDTTEDAFDFDRDGVVSILDFPALRQVLVMGGHVRLLGAWAILDTDNDNQISGQEALAGCHEFQEVLGSKSEAYDFNGDGVVDMEDWPALSQALMVTGHSALAMAWAVTDEDEDFRMSAVEANAVKNAIHDLISSGGYESGYDFNGDKTVDEEDREILAGFLDEFQEYAIIPFSTAVSTLVGGADNLSVEVFEDGSAEILRFGQRMQAVFDPRNRMIIATYAAYQVIRMVLIFGRTPDGSDRPYYLETYQETHGYPGSDYFSDHILQYGADGRIFSGDYTEFNDSGRQYHTRSYYDYDEAGMHYLSVKVEKVAFAERNRESYQASYVILDRDGMRQIEGTASLGDDGRLFDSILSADQLEEIEPYTFVRTVTYHEDSGLNQFLYTIDYVRDARGIFTVPKRVARGMDIYMVRGQPDVLSDEGDDELFLDAQIADGYLVTYGPGRVQKDDPMTYGLLFMEELNPIQTRAAASREAQAGDNILGSWVLVAVSSYPEEPTVELRGITYRIEMDEQGWMQLPRDQNRLPQEWIGETIEEEIPFGDGKLVVVRLGNRGDKKSFIRVTVPDKTGPLVEYEIDGRVEVEPILDEPDPADPNVRRRLTHINTRTPDGKTLRFVVNEQGGEAYGFYEFEEIVDSEVYGRKLIKVTQYHSVRVVGEPYSFRPIHEYLRDRERNLIQDKFFQYDGLGQIQVAKITYFRQFQGYPHEVLTASTRILQDQSVYSYRIQSAPPESNVLSAGHAAHMRITEENKTGMLKEMMVTTKDGDQVLVRVTPNGLELDLE